MVKKQVDFQVGSYTLNAGDLEDIKRMRMEVKTLQMNGWEVLEVIHGGLRKDHNARDADLFFVFLAKYEYVDDTQKPVVEKKSK